ncbi:MAG TPA: hypothetical protein VKS79_14105 [Gemmataceae bacterium]|nr:hypothetical protein [Gemmataceae bacterium]
MSRLCTIVVSLIVFAASPALAGPEPAQPKVPRELLEKRLAAAQKVFQENLFRFKNREGLSSELFGWPERCLEARLALADKQSDRVNAFKTYLSETREVERIATSYARTGQGRESDAQAATYYRLEAEIRLIKEGIEIPPEDKKGAPGKP